VAADIQLTGTLLSSVLASAQAGDRGSEARNVTILTPLAFNEYVYGLYYAYNTGESGTLEASEILAESRSTAF
jgi:hypothetical protein